VAATPLYTLSDRREIVTESGSKKWEYREKNRTDANLVGCQK